ncbi:MAG: N-acetylneuraminate synthase family protein [Candidatus Omnitrophota bacterium]|nr:N-acetylneuraminate synthase family protein [Candidatus Omnitrophota bacterium]
MEQGPFITINGHQVGPDFPVYIIAEIGINHNGCLSTALEMVRVAKSAGADAVKVQILTADRCYSRNSPSYAIFKKAELTHDDWRLVFKEAQLIGIDCFATFVDVADLKDFSDLVKPAVKISSSCITNMPLLEYVAKLGVPVLVSSGMSDLEEVREAVRVLRAGGQKDIALFHCTSLYPAPIEALNLRAIRTIASEFSDIPVGYSDHSAGIMASVLSVALGSVLVEKHFTLNKQMEGPDHHFSADPQEMIELVTAIRSAAAALGRAEKAPDSQEVAARGHLRRTIVALRDISAGEALTPENTGLKRCGSIGLAPGELANVLGRVLRSSIKRDDPITERLFLESSV